MSKKQAVPVHRLEGHFSGVYITPLGRRKSSPLSYETSLPHRHDFYYCVVLESGSLELAVDFEKVAISWHELFLSYPGQLHQVTADKMEKGWFLAFDPSVIDDQLRDTLGQCLSEVLHVKLTDEQTTSFSTLIRNLHGLYDDSGLMFREKIVQSVMNALIYQVAATYISVERSNLMKHPARSVEVTKKFRQLLRRNFREVKKPSGFAAQLNITTSHLNDTVKSVTGFSVSYHIRHELVREAQRLLSEPELAVKQIADSLGFEDPKYFSRLFKKITGVSPGSFRKKAEHLSVYK